MADSLDRRSFLCRAAAMLPIMHAAPLLNLRQDAPAMPPSTPAPCLDFFARLRLRTAADMEAMARFYREALRLPVENKSGTLEISAGNTIIEFTSTPHRDDRTDPYYHFAFNIPHNKLDAAMNWLQPRCPLIKRGDGSVVFHFQAWDAHAFYFLDPAGNILEFIARHTLKNDAPPHRDFTEKDILSASEIGVVAPDVVSAADQLCKVTKQQRYHGGDGNFTAVGDEHGLFIVVKTGRRWFSSDRAAEVFECEANVRGDHAAAPIQLSLCKLAAVADHRS